MYSIFDLSLTGNIVSNWPAAKSAYDAYRSVIKPKFSLSVENEFIERCNSRIASGLTFLPSITENGGVTVLIYTPAIKNTAVDNYTPVIWPKKLREKILELQGKYQFFRGIISPIELENTVVNSGVYVALRPPLKKFETWRFGSHYELRKCLDKLNHLKEYNLENWQNVALRAGKDLVPDIYNVYKNYYSPSCSKALFGHKTLEDFIRDGTCTSIERVELIGNLDYRVKLKVDLPDSIDGILMKWIGDQFIDMAVKPAAYNVLLSKGSIKDEFLVQEIVYVFSGSQQLLAAIASDCQYTIESCHKILSNTEPIKQELYRKFRDEPMIMISAGKGSGKSGLTRMLKGYKRAIIIDSDDYGRYLTLLSKLSDEERIVLRKNGSNLARWIADVGKFRVIKGDEGALIEYDGLDDKIESAIEGIARSFIKQENYDVFGESMAESNGRIHTPKPGPITIENIVRAKLSGNCAYRFTRLMVKVCSKLLPFDEFITAIGFIPSVLVSPENRIKQRFIVFVHNSHELFSKMGSASICMVPAFDTLLAVLTRNRPTDKLIDMFLWWVYIQSDGTLTSSVTYNVLYDVLKETLGADELAIKTALGGGR